MSFDGGIPPERYAHQGWEGYGTDDPRSYQGDGDGTDDAQWEGYHSQHGAYAAEAGYAPPPAPGPTANDLLGFLHEFRAVTGDFLAVPSPAADEPWLSYPKPDAVAVVSPPPGAAGPHPNSTPPPTGPPPGAPAGPAAFWNQPALPAGHPAGTPQYPPPVPYPAVAPADSNTMATVAMVFGLCSLVLPVILSIPGFVLGIISLQRVNRQPWIGRKKQAVTAIVTSVVIWPVSLLIAIPMFLGATSQENMGQVRSIVSSAVASSVQQATGSTPRLDVQCPSSEPRKNGTTFSCSVTDLGNGRQVSVGVRVIDSHGDVLLTNETSDPS